MGKYFGTDGIRGVANTELSVNLAFKAGCAAAVVLCKNLGRRAKFFIGKDTRISSDMLECALAAGISSMGADVGLLGYMPTPAVAYLTVNEGADAGIVISASHNPMEFNGIKIFNAEGYKLADEIEAEIEALIDDEAFVPTATGADVGRVERLDDLAHKYVDYLASTIQGDLTGLKILVDCANGAAYNTAGELFSKVADNVRIVFNEPDGTNINRNCGSTKLNTLRELVKADNFDVGVAFDGDADRCLIVDERGEVVDGDMIMAICAKELKAQGKLPRDTFVATVLSNMGLDKYAEAKGMKVAHSAVGDRNVLEMMRREGYVLGGEQSGHVIFLNHSTTGDGELCALQFLSIVKNSGKKVSELTGDIEQFPQIMINVKVENHLKEAVMSHEAVKCAIDQVEAELDGMGRVLLRPSGTEPMVRVMVEGRDSARVNALCASVANTIEKVLTIL